MLLFFVRFSFFFQLFCFFCLFSFPFFASKRKRGLLLFIFECLLLFLLCLFWPPPFSISPALSLSCYFLFCLFLPSCLSLLLYFGSLFLSLSLFFLSSLLLFHERNNIKYSIAMFLSSILLFFPVLLFLSNPFFLSLLFLVLSYVFAQHQ